MKRPLAVCSGDKRKITQAGGVTWEGLQDDYPRLHLVRGLSNEAGHNNCFLNVIIQSLWHLRSFREPLLRMGPVVSSSIIVLFYKIEQQIFFYTSRWFSQQPMPPFVNPEQRKNEERANGMHTRRVDSACAPAWNAWAFGYSCPSFLNTLSLQFSCKQI